MQQKTVGDLAEGRLAFHEVRLASGRVESRKQYPDQNCDDTNHHQQLDQSKAAPAPGVTATNAIFMPAKRQVASPLRPLHAPNDIQCQHFSLLNSDMDVLLKACSRF
jgi:hypothetical protein